MKLILCYKITSAIMLLCLTMLPGLDAIQAAESYGAIAFSPSTQGNGYTFGYATREAAEQGAIRECERYSRGGDCESVVWFQHGCVALAVGADRFGTGLGPDRYTAENEALKSCENNCDSRRCVIARWICN